MKSIFIPFICLALLSSKSIAQDEKHENHMKEVEPVETEFFKVEFSGVHCQLAFAMGKMKITNKTSDFLIFDQSSIKGNFDFGTLENEKGKELIIDPYGSASRNFKFTGDAMHVDHFSIDVSAFAILSVEGTVQQGEMFVIPPKSNIITIGNYECTFGKMKKKTDKLDTDFECRYMGKNYGIVDETKASFVYPNGNEYANAQNKQKLEILEPGDSKKFTFNCSEHKADGDLQFIEMKIKWNGTFVESVRKPLPMFQVDFGLDAAKTAEAN